MARRTTTPNHPAHDRNIAAKALRGVRACEASADYLVERGTVATRLEGLRHIRRLLMVENDAGTYRLIAALTGDTIAKTSREALFSALARSIEAQETPQGDPFAGLTGGPVGF